MAFSVQYHTDPQEFMAQNKKVLLKYEALNNQIFGFLSGVLGSTSGHIDLMATIKLNQKILGCAIMPQEDQPLILTPLPNNAAMHLANELAQQNMPLAGVTGAQKTVNTFVAAWCRATGDAPHLATNLGLFTATKCPDLSDICNGDKCDGLIWDGSAIIAEEKHRQPLISLCHGYIEVCFPEEADKGRKATQLADMHIQQQTALMLLDRAGEAVSVAVLQRQTPHMACLSMVYTPPRHRGKGYGQCVVAALTTLLFERGFKKCLLFADLNNPITPHFYCKIGYRHVDTVPRYTLSC